MFGTVSYFKVLEELFYDEDPAEPKEGQLYSVFRGNPWWLDAPTCETIIITASTMNCSAMVTFTAAQGRVCRRDTECPIDSEIQCTGG